MNDYYNFNNPVEPGSLVDATAYNQEMMQIDRGFSFLPPPDQLLLGTLIYTHDTGSVNHSVGALVFGSTEGPYLAGETFALNKAYRNTGITTFSVNNRSAKTIRFDVFGGSAAGDLKVGGIYSFTFDGTYMWCMEMTTRYLSQSLLPATSAAASAASATASATVAVSQYDDMNNMVNNPSLSSDVDTAIIGYLYPVGCVEIYPNGVLPASLFSGTGWVQLPISVSTLTGNMVPSTNLTAWRRSA